MNQIGTDKQNSRISLYDAAKGICIISVVMGHCNILSRFVYFFHIICFFFISGLFLGGEKYTFKVFLLKRIKSLYIPYVVLSIVFAILFDIKNFLDLKYIIRIFLFDSKVPLTGTFWFIPCLFINSSIAFFIEKSIKQIKYLLVILCIFLCLCLIFYVFEIRFYYNLHLIPWIQIIFLLALLFKKMNFIKFFYTMKQDISLLCFSSIIYVLIYFFPDVRIDVASGVFPNVFVWFIIIINSVLFVFSISSFAQYVKVFSLIGKHSFYIMCLHFCVFAMINIVLSGFTNSEITYKLQYKQYAFIYVLLGVTIPLFISILISFIKGRCKKSLCKS